MAKKRISISLEDHECAALERMAMVNGRSRDNQGAQIMRERLAAEGLVADTTTLLLERTKEIAKGASDWAKAQFDAPSKFM